MPRSKLDKIDRKILKLLQDNGRITNVDLAKSVGISAPPCLRRVRALEDSGYIKSYHAKLSPSSMGYGVTVYAMVSLHSHAEKDLAAFADELKQYEQVRECHMLAGDVDFLLKIVAKDWDDYQEFLTTKLTAVEKVSSIKSSLAIRSLKDIPGVPVEA